MIIPSCIKSLTDSFIKYNIKPPFRICERAFVCFQRLNVFPDNRAPKLNFRTIRKIVRGVQPQFTGAGQNNLVKKDERFASLILFYFLTFTAE